MLPAGVCPLGVRARHAGVGGGGGVLTGKQDSLSDSAHN